MFLRRYLIVGYLDPWGKTPSVQKISLWGLKYVNRTYFGLLAFVGKVWV